MILRDLVLLITVIL